MPATRNNVYMLPANQSIFSSAVDKDNHHRMYRSTTTRHYPPSPPSTSHPSTPIMTSATATISSSRRASFRSKSPYYATITTPSSQQQQQLQQSASMMMRPTSTHSIPSPNMSKQDEDTSSPFFNLEKVVQQYGEQRDLLELILSSKVEEDRRRAEEAKLRQKEIDYLLQQHTNTAQQQQQQTRTYRSRSMSRQSSLTATTLTTTSDKSIHNWGVTTASTDSTNNNIRTNATPRRFSDASSSMNNASILPRIQSPLLHHHVNRPDSAASHSTDGKAISWRNIPSQEQQQHRTERRKSTNNIDLLLSHSPKSVSATLPPITSPTTTSSISAIATCHPLQQQQQQQSAFNIPPLNQVTSPATSSRSSISADLGFSPTDVDGDTSMTATTIAPTPMTTSMDNNNNNCGSRQHPITMHNHPQQIEPRQVYQPMLPSFPPPDKLPILPATSRRLQRPTAARRRRRREMQAISTIIETREFPYNDDYLWKNNGNTVHKKSGFRSIYYKCSNSAKGCPVNKTVTFKEHGNYLIKYRGEHLDECNRIKRIVDV